MTDKAVLFRRPTLFGLAIETAEHLPRNGFMMVSRLSAEPAIYQVLVCKDGEIRDWRGTLEMAYALLRTEQEP